MEKFSNTPPNLRPRTDSSSSSSCYSLYSEMRPGMDTVKPQGNQLFVESAWRIATDRMAPNSTKSPLRAGIGYPSLTFTMDTRLGALLLKIGSSFNPIPNLAANQQYSRRSLYNQETMRFLTLALATFRVNLLGVTYHHSHPLIDPWQLPF
jgi:hypothetical protein